MGFVVVVASVVTVTGLLCRSDSQSPHGTSMLDMVVSYQVQRHIGVVPEDQRGE